MFDINSYLIQLREEQVKKLESLNGKMGKTENNDVHTNTLLQSESSSSSSYINNNTSVNSPIFTNSETSFKMPIEYLEDKKELNANILNDLELIESKDPSGNPMYAHIFKPESVFAERFINKWSKYYTTNIDFLKDSQVFYKSYVNKYGGDLKAAVTITTEDKNKENNEIIIIPHEIYEKIDKLWIDIAGDTNFKQRFSYIDVPILDRLNKSPGFLQLLSIYNLTSPVISLLSPIILLIIPFFILKFQKVDITISGYIATLRKIFATHPIGKMFSLMDFSSMSWDKRIYLLMSIVFYIIQIYQNIMSCYKFYKNMILIHKNIFILRDYFLYTIENMNHIIKISSNLGTYSGFIEDMQSKKNKLEKLCNIFSKIKPFKISFGKMLDIGKIMKLNYEIFVDNDMKQCVDYSFGFNAFYEHVDHLSVLINGGKVNACSFIIDPPCDDSSEKRSCDSETKDETNTKVKNKKKKIKSRSKDKNISEKSCMSRTSQLSCGSQTSHITNKTDKTDILKDVTRYTRFTKLYYPPYDNPVKNDVTIDKKIIITGPNAAGKTTVIKSTLLNIILSQQLGYGFYETGHIRPYDYLHCYLNIPDTSGRDSLFQAESRRCKEILDCLEKENTKNHFCIFDELYSGTNPYEAVASAYGYIDHLSKIKNVDLMLTTHYIQLCTNLKSNRHVKNYHMSVEVKSDYNVEYLYKFKKGISTIKGGIKVLYDLEYPESIIESTKKILNEM
jgi:hypothetical protein